MDNEASTAERLEQYKQQLLNLSGIDPHNGDSAQRMAFTLEGIGHTLVVKLNAKQKRELMQFLYESHLISKDDPVLRLHGFDFNSADLKDIYLQGAYLHAVKLEKADLRNANLKGANLIGANLTNADLTGAELTNATMRDAEVTEEQLGSSKSVRVFEWPPGQWVWTPKLQRNDSTAQDQS